MSLNKNNKRDLKKRFKELWEVKEFKYGIFVVIALLAILVLQLTGLL